MASNGETSSRLIDWAALVRQAWGPEFYQPDTALLFSNGREFKSTDSTDGGVYAYDRGDAIDQEEGSPTDLRGFDLLLEDGSRLLQE